MKIHSNKKGQTLVEVVLAIGLAVIVIAALAVLGITSLRVSKSSLRRSEAAKLASAGIEATRFVRDSEGGTCGLSGFGVDPSGAITCYEINSGSGSICNVLDVASNCNGAAYSVGGDQYTRKIEIGGYESNPTDEIVFIRVTVSWDESAGVTKEKSVILSNVLKDM